jgi:hypothetical protein
MYCVGMKALLPRRSTTVVLCSCLNKLTLAVLRGSCHGSSIDTRQPHEFGASVRPRLQPRPSSSAPGRRWCGPSGALHRAGEEEEEERVAVRGGWCCSAVIVAAAWIGSKNAAWRAVAVALSPLACQAAPAMMMPPEYSNSVHDLVRTCWPPSLAWPGQPRRREDWSTSTDRRRGLVRSDV